MENRFLFPLCRLSFRLLPILQRRWQSRRPKDLPSIRNSGGGAERVRKRTKGEPSKFTKTQGRIIEFTLLKTSFKLLVHYT